MTSKSQQVGNVMFNEDSKTRQEIRWIQKKMKKSPLLFARLGECYLQLGDWDRAEKALTKGVAEYPEYTTGLLVLGEGYLYSGLHRDALECVEKGLQMDPTHLGLLKLKERIKKQTEDEHALAEVRRRLKGLDPLYEVKDSTVEEAETTSAEGPGRSLLDTIAAEYGFGGGEAVESSDHPSIEARAGVESEERADLDEDEIEPFRLDNDEKVAELSGRISEMAQEADVSRAKREIVSDEESEDTLGLERSDAEEITTSEPLIEEPQEVNQSKRRRSVDEGVDAFGLAENESDENGLMIEGEEVGEEGEENPMEAGEEASGEEEAETITEETSSREEPEPISQQWNPRKKKIATKTLGELYATQKKYDEAIEIYAKLVENDPSNESYRKRLEELKGRREAVISEGVESTNE